MPNNVISRCFHRGERCQDGWICSHPDNYANPLCSGSCLKQSIGCVEGDPKMPKDYFRYITIQQLTKDAELLIPHVPDDCAGIVGIPRSGMLPATVLATKLHLPLFELTKDGPRRLGSGERGKKLANQGGKYFVVDDSTHNGGSIAKARQQMVNAIFATVYSKKISCADVSAVVVDPHLFEWNLFQMSIVEGGAFDPKLRGGMCFDFDGVLCEDTHFQHRDANEDKVIEWLLTAKPKHLVRGVTIPTIISFRLEKHRQYIQQWLDKWQVKVKNLILHPAQTFRARDANFNVVEHKAKRFAESSHCIMVESCKIQAAMIAKHAKKPVICTDDGSGLLVVTKNRPRR
jgi:orotate phosphoribosyltransferase